MKEIECFKMQFQVNMEKKSFLAKNFQLKPVQSEKSSKIFNKMMSSKIKLKIIDVLDYIPLSEYRKILIYKKMLNLKYFTKKLNRVKIIWKNHDIKFINGTVII